MAPDELLHPGVLDEGLRSGFFLSGLRHTGKTTFLHSDLTSALVHRMVHHALADRVVASQVGASKTLSESNFSTIKSPDGPALPGLRAMGMGNELQEVSAPSYVNPIREVPSVFRAFMALITTATGFCVTDKLQAT